MADQLVNTYKQKLMQGIFDHVNDTTKLMLLDSNHTTDIDAQVFIDDVSANEVSGTGYTAGGQTITNPAVTVDDTDNEGVFNGDDVTWSNATITAQFGAIYKDTGTPSTSPIIGILDFGSDQTSTSGNFTVSFDSEGIVNIT